MATLGLIYLSPTVKNKLGFVTDRFNLREIFSATISAQIFVLPLLIYKTGLFSIVGLPVNFLILAVYPLDDVFGFAVGITGMFSALLSLAFCLGKLRPAAQYELFIVDIFAKLPFSAINISGFSEVFLLLSYAAIFFDHSFIFARKKSWRSKNIDFLLIMLYH